MINVRHEFIFFHSIAPETLRQQCSPTSSSPASLATGHLTGHLYPSSDFTGGSCNYFKLSTVQSPISASFGAAGKKTEQNKKKFFFLNFTEFLSNFMITYDFNWFKVIPIWWMEWCLQPLQRPLQPIRTLCLEWPLWPIRLHHLNLMPLTQQGKF